MTRFQKLLTLLVLCALVISLLVHLLVLAGRISGTAILPLSVFSISLFLASFFYSSAREGNSALPRRTGAKSMTTIIFSGKPRKVIIGFLLVFSYVLIRVVLFFHDHHEATKSWKLALSHLPEDQQMSIRKTVEGNSPPAYYMRVFSAVSFYLAYVSMMMVVPFSKKKKI